MGSRIKTYLKSEKAMSTINLVFFLSLLIRNKGIIFIAYLLWIGYLSYCIKSTSSKVMKTVFWDSLCVCRCDGVGESLLDVEDVNRWLNRGSIYVDKEHWI